MDLSVAAGPVVLPTQSTLLQPPTPAPDLASDSHSPVALDYSHLSPQQLADLMAFSIGNQTDIERLGILSTLIGQMREAQEYLSEIRLGELGVQRPGTPLDDLCECFHEMIQTTELLAEHCTTPVATLNDILSSNPLGPNTVGGK